ncbi:MAG: thrombospondin type 3 repeat-containing protein [Proteobacteria bacterium]|nr:thrombospondin type 3 repeat-containing protein [Pseudomonadota bacterium]
MRVAKTTIALVFMVMLAAPATALAQCYINDYGVLRLDTDCDAVIDNTDMNDADFDGIPDGDPVDNCPAVPNGNCGADQLNCDADMDSIVTATELQAGYQRDWNDNGIGDVCDDSDYDGVTDHLDNCKTVYNPSQDPSVCTDSDGDKFEDPIDNCPSDYNPNQLDSDDDGVGDACDNCRIVYNPGQADADGNKVGDACEGEGYVPPEINQDESQDVNPYDRPISDLGPDEIEGNGFGKGGCSLIGPQATGCGAALIMAALGALVAWRRRR